MVLSDGEKIPAACQKKYQQLARKNTRSFPEKIPVAFLSSPSIVSSQSNQSNQPNQSKHTCIS
jgi:hypothetical protein